MQLWELIIISLSLTFDTFAVSIAGGINLPQIRFWQGVKVALILAIFQAGMPLLGYFGVGWFVNDYFQYNYIIAASLLFFIGGKMLWEALNKEEKSFIDIRKFRIVLGLAIATSIDAFAVGISFAFGKVQIWLAFILIGFFTFLVAMLGMLFGKNLGHLVGKRAEILGGIVLLLIGIKIVLENL